MKPKDPTAAKLTWATAQGGRHRQEDRAVHKWVETPIGAGWLLAVFDGHRGAASADAAAKSLPGLFQESFVRERGNATRALEIVFRSLHGLTEHHPSGSTASVVFIPQDAESVTVAVLGDSPVAVLDAGSSATLGADHNVRTNLQERRAAEARGGLYRAGYLEDSESPGVGLQIARSLGDVELARTLDRSPEIDVIPLGGRGIVLVGSDGLLLPGGVTNADQMKRYLTLIEQDADAEAIVADALARAADDNVTAIVWQKT